MPTVNLGQPGLVLQPTGGGFGGQSFATPTAVDQQLAQQGIFDVSSIQRQIQQDSTRFGISLDPGQVVQDLQSNPALQSDVVLGNIFTSRDQLNADPIIAGINSVAGLGGTRGQLFQLNKTVSDGLGTSGKFAAINANPAARDAFIAADLARLGIPVGAPQGSVFAGQVPNQGVFQPGAPNIPASQFVGGNSGGLIDSLLPNGIPASDRIDSPESIKKRGLDELAQQVQAGFLTQQEARAIAIQRGFIQPPVTPGAGGAAGGALAQIVPLLLQNPQLLQDPRIAQILPLLLGAGQTQAVGGAAQTPPLTTLPGQPVVSAQVDPSTGQGTGSNGVLDLFKTIITMAISSLMQRTPNQTVA